MSICTLANVTKTYQLHQISALKYHLHKSIFTKRKRIYKKEVTIRVVSRWIEEENHVKLIKMKKNKKKKCRNKEKTCMESGAI